MSTNTSISLVNLDFESLKNGFKTYLKTQNNFKDYDFEGSNINVLMDLLAYNTYINAFYLNMVGSEMFLDSAQLRESVISRAKELNYTPRSFKSARATVALSFTSSASTFTIPKGFSFTSKIGSNSFSFCTDQNKIITGNGTPLIFNSEIQIFEGYYVSDSFTINTTNLTQRFMLSNPTIDTDSLTVSVIEDNGTTVTSYAKATSLFDKTSISEIYFLQGAEDEKYEILFGDGVIGKKPKDGSLIFCEYRICKGELPNGAFKFSVDDTTSMVNPTVEFRSAAAQGSISETIESIKFNAPRYFTSQERAITAEDYKSLLLLNFPEINTVSVFGGEEATPPVYGKVYIAIDLKNVDGVPDIRKQDYYNFIKPRTSLSIDPVFIDPDFMYVSVETTIRYNLNTTALKESSLKELVLSSIRTYNDTYIDDFNVILRYSNFINSIDDVDKSILGNDTTIRPIRLIVPELGTAKSYDISFSQELQDNLKNIQLIHPLQTLTTITSTDFIYGNKTVSLQDDGNGILQTVSLENTILTVIENVGTVDYITGKIQLKKINITQCSGSAIKVYARTKRRDISSLLQTILSIKDEDVIINIIPERV